MRRRANAVGGRLPSPYSHSLPGCFRTLTYQLRKLDLSGFPTCPNRNVGAELPGRSHTHPASPLPGQFPPRGEAPRSEGGRPPSPALKALQGQRSLLTRCLPKTRRKRPVQLKGHRSTATLAGARCVSSGQGTALFLGVSGVSPDMPGARVPHNKWGLGNKVY